MYEKLIAGTYNNKEYRTILTYIHTYANDFSDSFDCFCYEGN